MNYYKLAAWFVVLVLAIITVAYVLSILPQQIIWILFIAVLTYCAIRIKQSS